MKHILVPTDLSELSDTALKSAINFSKKTPTTIHLLHAIQMTHLWEEIQHFSNLSTDPGSGYSFIHFLTQKANEELKIKAETIINLGITCEIAIITDKPYLAIINYIKEKNISLCIMGTSGASGLNELLIGSNAQHVIRRASCPVIIVKKDAREINIKHIVWASDFLEDEINQNLIYLNKIATYYQAIITLLFVNTDLNFETNDATEQEIRSVADAYGLSNFDIFIQDAPKVEEGINTFCQNNSVDLVAITTHGSGFMRKLFVSNTTEYLANHLEIPLMSVPMSYRVGKTIKA